jgi:hypothetical protein
MKVKIIKSHLPEKKFDAVFTQDNGREKTVSFGAKGYSDYTKHHDEARKERYIERHERRENFNDPMTAGSLSRWILWNKPSLQQSIKDFKKRFHII